MERTTHRQRLIQARYAKRKVTQMLKVKQLTEESFEFKKINMAKKKLDGKWEYEVEWENTFVPPAAIFGCEDWMAKHIPSYQGKTPDEVREDLIKKQMENDRETDEVLKKLAPKDIRQKELDELEELQKMFPINQEETDN